MSLTRHHTFIRPGPGHLARPLYDAAVYQALPSKFLSYFKLDGQGLNPGDTIADVAGGTGPTTAQVLGTAIASSLDIPRGVGVSYLPGATDPSGAAFNFAAGNSASLAGRLCGLSAADSSSLCIAALIKTSMTGVGGIVDADTGGGSGRQWQFRMASGVLQAIGFTAGAAAAVTVTGAITVNNGAWHHVAAIFDGVAKTWKVYVDGTLDATSAVMASVNSGSATVYIGANNGSAEFYQGLMSRVAIWQGVGSAQIDVAAMAQYVLA